MCTCPLVNTRFRFYNGMYQLLIISLSLGLSCSILGGAVTPLCTSVYRGFAECLVTLGHSVNSQTSNTQDIGSICKSWDAFQLCVTSVLSNCQGDATDVWESLKTESRQMLLSGNLYEICASYTMTTPQTPLSTYQTNQESLKALAACSIHTHCVLLILSSIFVLLRW